jgi:hypothetical protein
VRWVDFEHDCKTLEPEYMESVTGAFKTLFDRGLVYEGQRVLPYCWNGLVRQVGLLDLPGPRHRAGLRWPEDEQVAPDCPDVSEVFGRDGADAMRWFLMSGSIIVRRTAWRRLCCGPSSAGC